MGLSEYEQQRERNIADNNKRLAELGLEGSLAPKKKAEPKPKRQRVSDDPEWKPERITRQRTVVGTKPEESADDDTDDEEHVELPKPKALRKAPLVKPESVTAPAASDQCIVIEAAKTGRSKCRGCMEPLAQGEMRVGQESWMVGRAIIVWQHPSCFYANVAVTTEASGRGRCKQTKEGFAVGEAKISCTAHTTTAHYKPAAVAAPLRHVCELAGKAVESLEGFALLSAADACALRDGATNATAPREAKAEAAPELEETPTTAAALAEEGELKQPALGKVERAKGKVCWRFAGHLCYGTLLAAQESKTHCYARTHKGNTKTLKKGGSSWWMMDV